MCEDTRLFPSWYISLVARISPLKGSAWTQSTIIVCRVPSPPQHRRISFSRLVPVREETAAFVKIIQVYWQTGLFCRHSLLSWPSLWTIPNTAFPIQINPRQAPRIHIVRVQQLNPPLRKRRRLSMKSRRKDGIVPRLPPFANSP